MGEVSMTRAPRVLPGFRAVSGPEVGHLLKWTVAQEPPRFAIL